MKVLSKRISPSIKQFFTCILFLSLCFTFSCEDQKVASKTEPKVVAECPPGYHPCADDSSACCPFDIPATMEQTQIDWPSLADTPWPMYMHDPQLTGRSPYEGPSDGIKNWEVDLGWEIFSNPVIDLNGNIIVSQMSDSYGGYHELVSVSSGGAVDWKVELGGDWGFSPLITSDSLIYVLTAHGNNGKLVQLDLQGNINWEYPMSLKQASFRYTPNISKDGNTIYACGFDEALVAIKKDGSLQWKYSIALAKSGGSPALSPDGVSIYFIGSNYNFYSVNKDGTLNWKLNLGGALTSPAIDSDGNIYIQSGSRLYAISPEGYIRWKYENLTGSIGYLNGCTIGPDGTIYATRSTSFYAFDYAGNVKWAKQLANMRVLFDTMPVTDKSGNTYLGTAFTAGNGNQSWYLVNFVSWDSEGNTRYKLNLQQSLDIDSPGCIDQFGNLYVGSDASKSSPLFKIR